MSIIEVTTSIWQANRVRTLAVLDTIAELPNPADALGWRPGSGRAHIAWQLMHIGATEEVFATKHILGTPPEDAETIARFRGGSTPDDDIPSVDDIRRLLETSREHLLATIDRKSVV